MNNFKLAIVQNKVKVISSIIVILTIIAIVMIAIYHANETQRRRNLIETNPELARAMTYGELTEEDEKTQSENVRFSSYFARDLNGDGYADRVKGTCKEVEGEDTLYMSLNVLEDGYLKDAKIEIEADNIYFKTALVDDEVVQGNYISENTTTINLKQVQAGTQKLIFGQVRSGDYRYTSSKRDAIGKDTNKYSGINKITLTGTHVKNDGTETQIEKVIEVPVDWYGTTKAEIPYTYGSNAEKNKYQNYNTESIVDEEKQEVNLEFKIVSQESNNKLLLKKSTIEGTIPELNGYKPTKVEVTGENVQYTYDEETGNFTAYREATIGENGVVTKEAYTSSWGTARYSEFKLKVTYPLEAYEQSNGTVILNIPVKATFEGYNNENEEFNNPYISNTAEDIITVTYERGGGDVIGYDVQVGVWVPNPYNVHVVSKENAVKYYNQVQDDTKDRYEVRWYVSRGNSGEIANVQLREQDSNYTDKFLTTDGTYEDMLPYSKNIGIYFTTPGAMFGENGWIKVYNDETDELIHEFTSEDWDHYTKENPYMYDIPIDHIRIETSKAERVSSFTATSIKEMDNETLTTDKTREEFDKLSKIYSYLSGYAKYSEEEEYQKLKDDTGIANYDEPLSMAQITNITPTTLSTQEVANMKITIGTVKLGYNVESWKNGTFLLKFPEEVLLAEINSVNINNGNVSILGYDIYEQDGNYFLKILTENENPENYTITIDANITPDPRKISATKDIELYAYNEECNNYKDTLRAQDIYDINGDGNTEDIVDYSKRSVTFVGPSTLLTTETASDYNEEGDEIKTTVAPQVAEIDKTQNNRTAKISVQITNNYSGNISGIVVVGKTPFAGNTSQILGTDLGSTFTAKMTGPIELPENLQGIATVYYSENETVNSDLNDAGNNWKTADEITDFSKIRTYAIDLRDYVIEKNEEYICTYEIEVPQDVNYNDVSYSTHAVYFYLETDEGKLADQTETNKLGFRIARKYNLEINKVKQGTNSPIQGASFSVQEEGEESSRIIASDAQGKINIQDLYVGKVYTVKEIKAPSDYVLNGETIKFTTTVDDNGDLQVEKLEGNSNLNVEQATEEEPAKVSFTVTNEPKYTFKLTKEDQDGNLVPGVRFNLIGKGLPTAGRTVTTNSNGEITITGLYPNEEYTLTEVYAEGYEYSEAPIKFKTVWNGNDLEAQVIEGSFKEQPTVDNTQEKQPIMSASIVNTKLSEYRLMLGKSEKGTTKLLEGAVFNIQGKWINQDITTDENGSLEVGPLYEGIEYTIKEVMPPEGYALSDNTVRFVVKKDEEGKQYLQILEGEIKPIADFETGEEGISTYVTVTMQPAIDKDGNTMEDKYAFASVNGNEIYVIALGLDNEPLFSLTKIDGETQEPLPNVKFAITKVEDDGTETQALNSKGEVIGETVQIDDQTYQVITTDEQGRITEDLPEGYYKVVEIETAEGYQLPENEEDRTYFFGIGKTKPAVKEMVELWSQNFEGNGQITYTDSVATDDGGYIKIGNFVASNSVTFDADETESGEEIVIPGSSAGRTNAVIIKFNNENKVKWFNKYQTNMNDGFVSIVKSNNNNYVVTGWDNNGGHNINHFVYDDDGNLIKEYKNLVQSNASESKILQTSDGGFVAIQNFNSAVTIPAENTVNNQEIVIDTNGNYDGLVIKYNSEHKVEWARSIGGKASDQFYDFDIDKDGNIIVVGYFSYDYGSTENDIKIPVEETVNKEEIILSNQGQNDPFIIKYTSEGLVEWAEIPGATNNYESFKSIHINNENKYIISGYLGNYSLDITSDKTVNGQSIRILGNYDIIQYNDEGKIEWAEGYPTGTNGTAQKSMATTDEGYIQVGLFNVNASSITADQTANNQEIQLSSNGQKDYLILKFNKDNKIEWASQFGSTVEETDANIKSVIELPNNRYLVQVYLAAKATIPSEQTTLGEDVELLGNATLIYNSDGLVEYASSEVSSSSQYNSAVATSDGGQIAVGQMTGKLHIDREQTSTGEDIDLLSNGQSDALITKYNAEGKIEWISNIGSNNGDVINDIEKVDDKYIAVGYYCGNITIPAEDTVNNEAIQVTNANTNYNAMAIIFNEDGKIIKVNKLSNTSIEKFNAISKSEDGYVIVGFVNANMTIPAEDTADGMAIDITVTGAQNGIILKYNSDDKIEWIRCIEMNYGNNIGFKSVDSLTTGEYIVIGKVPKGEFTINAEDTEKNESIIKTVVDNNGGFIVIKFNDNGLVQTANIINQDAFYDDNRNYSVSHSNDGGYVVGVRSTFVGDMIIPAEETIDNKEIKISTPGYNIFLLRYNEQGFFESSKQIVAHEYQGYVKINNTNDNGYILTGRDYTYKLDDNLNIEYSYKKGVTNAVTKPINNQIDYIQVGYTTVNGVNVAKILKLEENTISAEIPEQQELTVENYKKEYKITTEVEGSGGSISGQGSTEENPYEIVKDGADSTKEIIITPEEGYQILKITVNGEEIDFVPEQDGSVILNKFTNMTSDKHVVVQFSNSVSTVIVHHYKYGTTEPYESLAEDDTLVGEIGDNYTTAPKDIEGYEVVMEELPNNASGEFTEDVQEVIYYYKPAPVKFIVHHYLEGTQEIVPGSEVYQINEERERGTEYTTSPLENLDPKYELVATPSNASGTLTENEIVVTYYYKIKERPFTIVKIGDDGEGLEGAYFKIESKETGKITYVTTRKNGEITETLEVGEYVVTEERAPEGYKVNRTPQTVNIELDKENRITITNEKINYFTLNMHKIDSETNENIQGAKFTLSYITQYGEERTEEYETTENGMITLSNLEDEIEYTLVETEPAKGYVANAQKYRFIAHYEDGIYKLEMLEGTFDEVELGEKEINCTINNTPTLKVIKQGEFGELLANAKFTITDEEGNEVTNGNGDLVGNVEEINGVNMRVITTDEQGEIVENLKPGTYILTEVQAPEGYQLPENEEDRITTIEITGEGYDGNVIEKTEEIYIDESFDASWIDFEKLVSMAEPILTNNGDVVFIGGLADNFTIPSENTVSGEEIVLEKISIMDSIILVLNTEGKVKEVYQNYSPENGANNLINMVETKEGKRIGVGAYMGAIEIPADQTVNNRDIILEAKDSNNTYFYMICYNKEGKVEWLEEIHLSEEQLMNDQINVEMVADKMTIQYNSADETITIPEDYTATGEEMVLDKENSRNPVMVVYNMNAKVEKVVEVRQDITTKFYSEVGIATLDGATIIAGYLERGSVIFDETETVSGEQIELSNLGDGVIVKYNTEGKIEWAHNLQSTNQYSRYKSLKEVADGYISFVYYEGEIYIPAEDSANGQEIRANSGNSQGKAVIKYNQEGKVEWLISDEALAMVNYASQIQIRETEEGYALIDINNMAILKYKETPTSQIANKQEVITLTNTAKDSTVLVHHYIKDSTTKLSEDVTITGKVGSDYHTEVATDIPANYRLVAEPENKDGKITANQTEVIYYYELKEPNITMSQITKESHVEKVTDVNQAMDYTVNYKATIDTYIGKAVITIVDTLPYEIDTSKPYNLNGGVYNSENKTITWIEEIDDIDTFANDENSENMENNPYEINFTKRISFTYKDIDVTQTHVENTVTGTIKLETPEKEETVETTKEIPTEYVTSIIVNKVWNDNETQAQRRPESLILVVKNGDQEVKTVEITKDDMVEGTTNQWSIVIDGLPKYNDNGEEIQYTVEEREKTEGDLKFYEAEENPVTVEDHQATIRNHFVRPDDTTTVTVSKVWNDNNNENGKRPESIIVKVTGNEQTYTQEINAIENEIEGNSNGCTYTFTDLPKYDDNGQEIVYTAFEEEVYTDDLKFYANDGITGDMTSGYTITNTFTVPDERIELTVNKVWEDNSTQAQRRPETIVINVKAENADNNDPEAVIDTYELNTATETSHTFTGLPKYNSRGDEIQYTVEEQEKNPGDLHFYTTVVGNVETTSENNKEVTITNTFEKPDDTTEVTVTKIWDDNNDEAAKRPGSIMLQLKNGNVVEDEQEVNESNKIEDQRKEQIIAEINERNNAINNGNAENPETDNQLDVNTVEVWQYTFTDVEKYNENGQEIVYRVDETEMNSNDLQFYNKEVNGLTVINTFTQDTTKVEVPMTKIWEDNEIQAQRRPESVVVILKANGIENQRYELSEETADAVSGNTWQYTFTDLPKYDEYNNIINYTVEEEEKVTGDLYFYTTKIDGTTITNTFTKPTDTIRIEVNKEWVDQDNAYEKRPNSIRLEVKSVENGTGKETVEQYVNVTKDDNWSATFTNLPKYDEDGQEIVYTVDEKEVMENDLFNYEKEIGEVTNKVDEVDVKEATITNTMTKIPGEVVVKYVDINTGEEISDSKTKEGIVGDTFDVTEDKKDIEGYTLVEEPDEKTGTYTVQRQTKIYYYAKDTSVIVKYLELDDTPEETADNPVLAKEVTIKGYEGKAYTTVEEKIPGYTLVATTDNLEGTMQRDEIVVIYYYAPNTNVIVKYLEQDDTPNDNSDNKVLAGEVNIEGYVGKAYTTTEETIPGYTLVATTDNLEGTMTKDPIEVIYYYAQNTKVIVKYLEQDDTPDDNTDNQVLAKEITIEGHAGQEYTTQAQDIEGYTLVARTDNWEGTMTNDVIEVIYYYAQNTKATVQHIDRETGDILKEETQEGKVGDLFETHAEDFEGYVLVESPEEPNIIMDKTGEQIVKYYYAHVSAGVIEKHIDDITGELLYSEEHQGNEGDAYNIPARDFEGYDLVTEDEDGNSRLPDNAQGEMKRDEVIEVKYYYIKKAKVIVKYLEEDDTPEDTTDNQVLAKEEIIEGHENDSYETKAKDIEDYNLVKTPENATGTMVITKNPDGTYNTEIEVIYYYKKAAGGVIENHIDITTGNILATEEHQGNVGDAYDIPSRTFEGYDLVEVDSEGNNMLPENATGTMTEEEIVVNYYYIKQAKVKVEYIDKITEEKLDEEEIQGHVGDSYETEEKEFDAYELVEKPSNSTGEMTEEETVVKYYYQRKAEVEVKYLEKGTEYEIAPSEIIEGLVGDNYETSEKDIPYYKFVEKTNNWEGTMTEEKITVIYYYEKQIFNLSVDKWVSSVNVNGIHHEARSINNKDEMYVVDIHRSKTETADIRITYTIRVTNTGEIEGTAGQIMEIIPKGYSYYQEDNNIYWEERNGTFVTDTLKDETIEPGEYKEIEIVLRWNKGEENFGEKENLVILTEANNPAGYQDVNEGDNHSTSDMMITVATGLDTNGRIILTASITMALSIILAVNIGLFIACKKKEK